ncbi:hypothetical protein NW066_03440 [Mycoplasmopsis felis]|uniref:hypothetical protein n=1 Tax=Mycoplasmopsis felis TaxID=33923 RepID=UPI0021B03ED9|nr:hypothetical protein [Mycoplasmopsis felis]UWV84667.1 hypothetical protein NW066_03440 [Mycoplasmopsis felis]
MFDLLNTSKESFADFMKNGIEKSLMEIYPITAGKIKIEYIKSSLKIDLPFKKITSEGEEINKCKVKGMNFSSRIYYDLRIENIESGELKDETVLLGEIPYMTSGEFHNKRFWKSYSKSVNQISWCLFWGRSS